jgi:FeS assembly SUF system protein
MPGLFRRSKKSEEVDHKAKPRIKAAADPVPEAVADTATASDTASAAAADTASAATSVGDLEKQVVETLKTIFDPEIPVNIYELGLIYNIDVTETGAVDVKMTLTAPGCPVAFSMPGEIEAKILSIPAVQEAKVTVVWEPPWNKDMMSEAAKLQLGFW